MKKGLKRISVLCVCMVLLAVSFLTPVAYAATGVFELAFDNLFIFEQWANHPTLKVHADDGTETSTISTDVSKGSFVLNNNAGSEVFTSFSMSSVGSHYNMPVEANTEYVFSYVANGTTKSFETFVFYFDTKGNFVSFESKHASQYGANEWSFTTADNIGYIQVRFDNDTPNSDVTVSDIKIRSKVVHDYAKDNTYRKTYTYTAGATYGALPVPQREGLVFAGWYTGLNGKGERITSSTAVRSESLSLYAKWDPIVEGDLSIISFPIKTDYCVGEKLDTKGLVIGVTYPGGTSENIDEGFSCSPESFTVAGTQTITVTYGNSSATFNVNVKTSENRTVNINGAQKTISYANNTYTLNYSGAAFNQYIIKYTSDAYVKGKMTFNNGTVEEFFLEPEVDGEFSGYIDGFISGTTQTAITKVEFIPLNKGSMTFTFGSLDLNKAENISEDYGMVYLSDTNYKIGIDLDWGGALTYMEDLANPVVAAQKKLSTNKLVEVGLSSEYSKYIYNLKNNVNLINAHDTGRLVQQSYYGTGSYPYEPGVYDGAVWNYNPVQGGNQFNAASKIVDLKVTDNEIYIKCRPLDWAKEAEYITPSYMEAWYTLENDMVRATCRFVDFSGYPSVTTTQELPAFYCVEPLNNFVYFEGGEAWSSNNTQTTLKDLDFWGTATDQDFICNENWGAFVGDSSSGYGIGIYTPGQTLYHSGVFQRDTLKSLDDETNLSSNLIPGQPLANHGSTSYIGVVDTLHFQSYTPVSYCYYIKTGNVSAIREKFRTVAQSETDICNATHTNGFCDMCGKYVAPKCNQNGVYEISNMGELCWFRDYVNKGNTNANAVLNCDITDNDGVLTSYGTVATDTSEYRKWTPIGNATNKYNGHFDGQGYTINGLYMDDTNLSYGGLFGYTGSNALIEKVGVDYSCFYGYQNIGVICGYNGGTINNCYTFYTVTMGNSNVGGVTGYNNGVVNNCYNAGIVNAEESVGGISGSASANASFSNCYYLEGVATDGNVKPQNGVGTTLADSETVAKKTLEQFASGEVAYILQKANTEKLWGQKTNTSGSGPIFDKIGDYAVKATNENNNYSLVEIGNTDEDHDIDAQDLQQLVNQVLRDDKLEYAPMLNSDIDGDGALDVIDISLLERHINGHKANIDVYLKGDFDFDGVPFTQEDIAAIKKALINQDKLNTKQKYACDLNFDGVLDIKDKDALAEQAEKTRNPIFTNVEEAIKSRSKTANVIILAGQSNAYGASPLTQAVKDTVGDTDFSNIKIKYTNINSSDGLNNWKVYYSNSDFETFRLGIGGQADMWFGPEVGLSYFLATNESTKDETWYIIKCTAAGTYLGGNWLYNEIPDQNNAANSENIKNAFGVYLAEGMINLVSADLSQLTRMHGINNVNVRSFLWMQGESDACVKEWADQYGQLQNVLVDRVRTSFAGNDNDEVIGFVDGAIAAYNSSYNSWVYSDTVNTHKSNNATLWYVPADTTQNVIGKTQAGLYQNDTGSVTKLENSIWIDTSTCKSKLENNNENGEGDGAHYCGDSMFKIGIWFAQGLLQVSDYHK